MADKPRQDQEEESKYRNVGMGIMIPTTLAACVLVGCFLGYLADKWFSISPWGVVLGLIFGCVAGVREMLKLLKKINKEK